MTSTGAALDVELRLDRPYLTLDLSLRVDPGTCVVIAGPSGAGKTTTLRAIAGLTTPDAGRVRCGEELWLDTASGRREPPERRRCGVVFQDYALFPHLSAWRNVAYGLRGRPRAARRAAAHAALERFGVAHLADARPARLSGGERQRVALARALAPDPAVLLLDEPLAALDAATRRGAARELAQTLAGAGVAALLVTHDFAEAALLGDEIAVLDAGRIVQRGSAAALAAAPASTFVADLAGAVVLRGRVAGRADGVTHVDLDGGGAAASTDPGEGAVALALFPWEIALELPAAGAAPSSARNRLPATVASIAEVGGRVRVGLAAAQPLTAEVTAAAVRELGLAPGTPVIATWKATATRLLPG